MELPVSPPPPKEATPGTYGEPPAKGGERPVAFVEEVIDKTFINLKMLDYFLPWQAFFIFKMLLAIITIWACRYCPGVRCLMINLFFGLCALCCFFFHFTIRFVAPDRLVYIGFLAPKRLSDFVRATMSAVVFVAWTSMLPRCADCLFPGQEMQFFWPWMVINVCIGLFLAFPC
ncbi:protein DMP8-like [Neltuma alba]|uniref:protein DMP8-like n=1 Tax=Neltuma alba TaxID=207710 RepID=UPI0010A50F94|nr:protein DMP8-like [Prosopis alba]